MSPEHKFVLLVAAIGAFPTIAFTGVTAYWTWRRDQERVVVRKSPVHWDTLDGVQSRDTLTGVGIVITNLSLFPIRVAGMGFRLYGKHAIAFDRKSHADEWADEIPSHSRIAVYATLEEWDELVRLGVRSEILDWKFVAVVRTETGREFASNRLGVKLLRPLRKLQASLKNRS